LTHCTKQSSGSIKVQKYYTKVKTKGRASYYIPKTL